MSDNISFELQVEILKNLPVKSLLQFRSVSKTWKSLIDSSDFIVLYSTRQTQLQHLFVSYDDADVDDDQKYVSYFNDDTFPQQKVSVILPLPLRHYDIIGFSHGLLCLYSAYLRNDTAFIWNISIRKGVVVVVPRLETGIFESILGFGVCRETNDPKIVKITQINCLSDFESITSIPWQVEIFTLSTRGWKSPDNNLPRKSVYFNDSHVVTDGFLYWLAIDRITIDGGFLSIPNLIISFDVTSEEFREVNLPHSLAHENQYNLSMSKLRESLVVLQRGDVPDDSTFVVWMMEDGVPELFAKLFTVNVNSPGASIKGFSRSGAPIVEINELQDDRDRTLLVVYKPYLNCLDNLGIDEKYCSTSVYPYMETLLLLDQHDMVYNDV